ncbi:MAG: hypothetical protein JF588_23195 [Caulobacterales bacterium]|nr:hypothetical protein [Caulobacterales bacterium]
MIFHLSIDADEPRRVAQAIAQLWGCEAYPFAPVGEDSWIAVADDGRNSAVEVYRRGVTLTPGEDQAMVQARSGAVVAYTPTHMAIATALSEAEVLALGEAEGWRTVRQSRGGVFDVIELWIENRLMVEVLTPDMQAQYLAGAKPQAWRHMMLASQAA